VEGNIVLTAFFNHQYSTMSILTEGKYGTNAWSSGPNALALFGTNPIVHDVPAAGCQICVAGKFNEQGGVTCQSCPSGQYSSTAQQSTCQDCSSPNFSIAGATSCDYTETTCPAGTYSNGTASCISYSPLPDGNGCCDNGGKSIITGCCSRENSLGGAFDDISGYSDGRTGNAKQQAALAKYGPFANWDISQVTNMKYALASINQYEVRNRYYTPVYSEYSGYTSTFNGDLSKWDVSRVTDMTNSKYSNIHNSFT
jgi:hypothetical protein